MPESPRLPSYRYSVQHRARTIIHNAVCSRRTAQSDLDSRPRSTPASVNHLLLLVPLVDTAYHEADANVGIHPSAVLVFAFSYYPHAVQHTMSSPNGPLTPTAISNSIFDKALEEHRQRLKDWELADFAKSTPEGLRSVVAEYHSTHAKKSGLLRCVQRISRVIAPLEKFFSAVDNGVSSHPEVAGIVWGALRLTYLQSIHSLSAYFEKIGDVLEDIAETLPHYQDYADTLFAKSQRVMEGLAGVYGDILLTCTTIRRIYKNAQGRRGSIIVSLRALNPWDRAFDDVVNSLKRRRERLDKRVLHEEMIAAHEQRRKDGEREAEERKWREEIEQRRLREEKEAREKERLRVLDRRKHGLLGRLQQSVYSECYSKHEACSRVLSKHLDAGRWLLNRSEFANWEKGPVSSSGMLWLRGKAGAGKTILSSIVVNSLSAQRQLVEGKTVAYFYCQFDDPQKRSDPRIVIGTLLHQVISQLPADDRYMPALGSSDDTSPDLDALRDALSSISRQTNSVYLIVDSLDEFDDSSRWKLVQALKRLSHDAKVFVTSRDLLPSQYQDDTLALLRDVPVIPADPEHVAGDIIDFVERNVRFIEEDGLNSSDDPEPPLKVASLPLRDEIRKVLLDRADGMFLYVRLQILHLRRQGTEHELRDALLSLPSGISATFIRALKDIEALPPQRRERVRRLFRWLACSPQPPIFRDILDAVVLDDMDDSWDKSKCITRPSSLLEDCGNLVKTELAGYSNQSEAFRLLQATIQFVHSSVKEFLVSRPSSPEEAPLPAYHYFPLSEARLPLVLTGFKYYDVADPDQSTLGNGLMYDAWEVQLRLAGEHGQHLVSAFRQFLEPGSSIRKKWKDYDWSESTWIWNDYNLYHLQRPKFNNSLPLHHIAIALHLPHIVPELVKRNSHTMESIVTADLEDINKPNCYGHTALQVACAAFPNYDDDDRVLRFLLEEGADVAAVDRRGQTALLVAASNISLISLQFLLDHRSDVHATDNEGRTALHFVADRWDSAAVEIAVPKMMRCGADVNARDHRGRTPLLAACDYHPLLHPERRLRTARVLFEHGASGSVVDAAGKTALHILAEAHRTVDIKWFPDRDAWWPVMEKLLQMLLAHGVDPYVADSRGRRAADYANFAELYLFLQGAAGEEPNMDNSSYESNKLPVADRSLGHKYVFTTAEPHQTQI
ncbi:hypothetical protein FA95DRAFT_1683378 [Auriscalpium vulgare]|uniref:Uncharacterized protein n=1 Tax=Auriscalpium vulgare TaxID=40419 RepID=A0ACB8RAT0_9AGAM|nr:hypothetical protein FA95DRAFT_1683378 [Auriscalpium vulgare]